MTLYEITRNVRIGGVGQGGAEVPCCLENELLRKVPSFVDNLLCGRKRRRKRRRSRRSRREKRKRRP